MIQPSPRLLIAAASAFVGLSAGQSEETTVADDGTRLLQRWGYWSHFDHRSERSSWPLVEAQTADEIAALATRLHVLREDAKEGDVFLQFSPMTKGFVRTGVIAEVSNRGCFDDRMTYYDVMTVEASTGLRGEFGGAQTLRVARRFLPSAGDRFVRWVEVDRYAGIGGRAAVIDRTLARVKPSHVDIADTRALKAAA